VKPSVFVLYYRNWPGVLATLDHLMVQSKDLKRVALIDNASHDGAAELIKDRYPSIEVVVMPVNYGYAGAFNRCVASMADPDESEILLLTHDCLLADGAVDAMSEALRNDSLLALVGPVLGLRDNPDQVFSGGGIIDYRHARLEHRRKPSQLAAWSAHPTETVDWIDGACMLVRFKALQSVRGLDARFFLYYEEVDFARRLRDQGWSVAVVPAAVAWQSTQGMPAYYAARNGVRFFGRHGGAAPLLRFILQQIAEVGRDFKCKRWTRATDRARGLSDGVTARHGPKPSGRFFRGRSA
jgi:N-acetylglucosaminyl-diphospho-decaprenol L-rhamnosyltransferase